MQQILSVIFSETEIREKNFTREIEQCMKRTDLILCNEINLIMCVGVIITLDSSGLVINRFELSINIIPCIACLISSSVQSLQLQNLSNGD